MIKKNTLKNIVGNMIWALTYLRKVMLGASNIIAGAPSILSESMKMSFTQVDTDHVDPLIRMSHTDHVDQYELYGSRSC